jgi:hypothetical protein
MSIPYEQIKAASLAQSESLLFSWFPNGKQAGDEFKIGNISGDPGSSLSINTRTGMWSDFAGDEKGGDLISLFAKKKKRKEWRSCYRIDRVTWHHNSQRSRQSGDEGQRSRQQSGSLATHHAGAG